jgi:programmed cell death protein 5
MSAPQSSQPNDEESKRREAEAAAMRQRALMVLLDPAARQRLMNIRIVKPELATAVENYLINDELKQILLSLQQPKRDFKINRR